MFGVVHRVYSTVPSSGSRTFPGAAIQVPRRRRRRHERACAPAQREPHPRDAHRRDRQRDCIERGRLDRDLRERERERSVASPPMKRTREQRIVGGGGTEYPAYNAWMHDPAHRTARRSTTTVSTLVSSARLASLQSSSSSRLECAPCCEAAKRTYFDSLCIHIVARRSSTARPNIYAYLFASERPGVSRSSTGSNLHPHLNNLCMLLRAISASILHVGFHAQSGYVFG
ncbi:hypothetical protein C8J57DRAFT_1717528 [Mycena rebaudengoi]|nr:hypothetical protein C8J57DRAFT_1717528 [Mycena rebaudengoi]